MICCIDCFKDTEIRAAIEMLGHKGNCPICKKKNTWIYDSEQDADKTNVEELLDSILEVYVPESELPILYPEEEKASENRYTQQNRIKEISPHTNRVIIQIRVIVAYYLSDRR